MKDSQCQEINVGDTVVVPVTVVAIIDDTTIGIAAKTVVPAASVTKIEPLREPEGFRVRPEFCPQ